MNEIVRKEEMAKGSIYRFDVNAPEIARKILPGQFVILRVVDGGERIPLTVADKDPSRGTISIIFQVVGKTTALLRSLEVGDNIKDLAGPLGKESEIKRFGTVVVIGGGTGTAILHHITKALKGAGNEIIGIVGARSKDILIMEKEMKALCDRLIITTDDGSHGMRGFVTDALRQVLDERKDIALVHAIGPIVMMKNVCRMTKEYGIRTMVSLNPIMIDGTGMCGGCRVKIDGKMKFCCCDGPEFDGHLVDFENLELRNSMYMKEERESLLQSITLERRK